MNLTFQHDKLFIDGEALDFENESAAAIYAELLVQSILNSLDCSPLFQKEFFERIRPAAAAYYDWRITPNEQWSDFEEYLEDDEPVSDGDDMKLLESLISLKLTINEAISNIVEKDD